MWGGGGVIIVIIIIMVLTTSLVVPHLAIPYRFPGPHSEVLRAHAILGTKPNPLKSLLSSFLSFLGEGGALSVSLELTPVSLLKAFSACSYMLKD